MFHFVINMADLRSEFSELIELLEKVHISCEKKRKEIEVSCQDYRELLAPWPDEARPGKKDEKRDGKEEIPKGEGGDIPEREIQELKLLDNVLAKAQKVRQKHEREVREDDDQYKDVNNKRNGEMSQKNQGFDEEKYKVEYEDETPETARVNQVQGIVSGGQKSSGNTQVASISKTKLNKLINMAGSSKKPPISASVKQLPKSSRQPGGMKKSYKLQAPYKTEPERLKMSSRTQRPASRTTSASNRTGQVSQPKPMSARPKVTSASRNSGKAAERKKVTGAEPSSRHRTSLASVSDVQPASEHLPEMATELDRNPANQQSPDIAKWLEDVRLSGIGEGDQMAKEHKEEEEIEKKKFTLKDDASRLVIPGKWKKLCAQNFKLRQKVREMQLKQEQSAYKQHFVDRLKSRFASDEGCSDVEIPYKLMEIQRKKKRLLEMMEEADVQNLSQDSQWQDICHAKVLLEFVHSQFEDLVSDISRTENTAKAVVNNSENRLALTSAAGWSDTADPVASDSNMWLPDELVHKKFVDMSYYRTTPEVMVYNNLKDLKRLVTLQHEAQILQLQIHIQKLVGERILPLLQGMDRKDPLFLTLYRTVYSILTTGGERFPTLVRDV